MSTDSAIHRESPAVEQALEASRERQGTGLTPRERAVEALVGGGFVAAAVALALLAPAADFQLSSALILVVALAATSLVTFDVGSAYTMPLQLAFVPMLFVLPPAAVPLCVAAGLILGKLPAVIAERRPPSRVLMAVGDSWFAVGPAVVFAIAQPGAPDGRDVPVYLLALAAQLACDATAGFIRERLYGGLGLRDQVREMRWIHLVDTLLSPVGLAVSFGAVERPWIVLLMLPLAALMLVFARERAAHVGYVIELSRAYRGTALVLGNVVEADDEYTGMHCQEVVDLAVQVADEMRLDAAARRNVEFGALLHDVGKIAIPKEIINKPGPLDQDEWALMRTHTIEGQRLLDQVGGFMREVGLIVRASHESYDGSGYPDGLVGEAIPLEARIVSCCDAYNAMTTDRSYRRARPPGEAIEELRRCAGTQFDPRVVESVVAVVTRSGALLPEPASLLHQPAP
jgi:putative nucleotidyltransferase with HDIG domain